ncbi:MULTISPECIES: DUF58 domain-containing protein [Bacillus]|uniref:DUF58 domain-containing protein n=2 Tax=Bacillus TaxID=1386 RepID=A0A0M4FKG9_9BACI|nr:MULTISPECIES: DUF58 domain-containing protein [Bacillus]ALC83861.1 hypothetical protein AM592_21885 [Bacillus gobiensis]MBP1083100.1 uncharacterized protein (DUF58 family) [Bacillus capparidis]MED1097949.1 DUF58 domain-containing protein [Bacillus capparidis]
MKATFRQLLYGWKLAAVLLWIIILFCYAMFQGGFVSWFLFYTFLPFGLYALLLAFYPISKMGVVREMNKDQFKLGEKLEATVLIRRKFPFPLFYILIEDEIPQSLKKNGQQPETKKMLFPWFKKEFKLTYSLSSMVRGEHQFQTIRIVTGDLLGLIEKEAFFEYKQTFLVYPSYTNMSYNKQDNHLEDGTQHSTKLNLKNHSIAVGVREYQPGDRFSWVDWKSSARRDRLMTKEFEQSKSQDLYILMDRSKSDSFEEMVTLAASIVRAALRAGADVGFSSVGKDRAVFPIQHGEQHLNKIFYHLALVEPNSPYPLSAILERELGSQTVRNAVKFIITSEVNLDLLRKIETGISYSQTTLYLVKKRDIGISQEEKVIIDRLKKQKIDVAVI